MTSPIIRVSVRQTCSKHEGNTKHYALLLMSFQIKGSSRLHSMVVRMYGSIGKASRVSVEHFGSHTIAISEYEQLLKVKHKRGYVNMFKNDQELLTESFLCEDSAERLFNNPSLRVLMLNTALTENTKTESLSAMLSHEDQENLADVVTAIMTNALTDGSSSAAAEQEPEAINSVISNAIAQLEQKRRESYGNEWGSW